jgi:methionyl-tRNA synthetase
MAERIYIGVGWPYANGSLHLGHIGGAYLPADIFARYHRMKGNDVLMVSGSDQHGTPVTIEAEREGVSPLEIADRYQAEFQETWKQLGIAWDLFTTTNTENHFEVAQDIFRTLYDHGYIYKKTLPQTYCPSCERFLPDRYVEGTCPVCKTPGARGDQCDACGRPMDTDQLIDPKCRLCGTPPVLRDSEQFFLKLTAFSERLDRWVDERPHLRPNVVGMTKRYINELHDRAITRDINWGIPIPLEGYDEKRIYVWFEAVIGYLSASKEWARTIAGDPDAWKPFWDEGSRGYYFIGKDNIPFHTVFWPAQLMGYGGLALPYDVPANEWVTVERKKASKSKRWGIWILDYLSRYDADPLRYMLSMNMPETADTDFTWAEFVRRNNDELVAAWGNLVNRVLTFTYRNFDGKVPEPAPPGEADNALLAAVDAALEKTGEELEGCHFKAAIQSAMAAAREANRYLDEAEPWKTIKVDRQAAATSLYTALNAISGLKTMLQPFLPFTSDRVHAYLGFTNDVTRDSWRRQEVPAGQSLVKPEPLFKKLNESIIDEEIARLGT